MLKMVYKAAVVAVLILATFTTPGLVGGLPVHIPGLGCLLHCPFGGIDLIRCRCLSSIPDIEKPFYKAATTCPPPTCPESSFCTEYDFKNDDSGCRICLCSQVTIRFNNDVF